MCHGGTAPASLWQSQSSEVRRDRSEAVSPTLCRVEPNVDSGGRFIVLEGIDGSGTTSQCRALAAVIEARSAHPVLITHEPSSGSIGRLIRARLAADSAPLDPHAMALLFAADRLDHVQNEIEPVLAAGGTVLCDRYLLSSWTYQALSCDRAWVETINRVARWPDLTFVIDVPVDVAQARIARRAQAEGVAAEIYDRRELQLQVAAGYETLLAESRPGVHRIDGTRPVAEVTDALMTLLDP